MNNSMINPSITELLEKVEDRYSLVIEHLEELDK